MSKIVARKNSVGARLGAGVSGARDGARENAHANAGEHGSLYDRAGRRKYLNFAERGDALTVMAKLPPDKALFALTLAWSGARVSEVLALTPASFQIDRQIVAFRTLKRRRHSVREVPIPAELMTALDAHFGLSAAQRDPATGAINATVNANANTNTRLWPWHRVTAWRLIKEVMSEAHISGRQSSPRGLRHGFGVGALQAHVPLNLVQRWLGHARISTTAIYADASGPEELAFAKAFWGSGA